jgi:tripartite-type tricarboxylate transporter receptor subunit TctC
MHINKSPCGKRRFCTSLLKAAILLGVPTFAMSSSASAASYPDKSIRLVVPYTPGGATDTVARIIARQLTTELGQTVIVENKPGAGGNIGTQHVAMSQPDGYTLLFATTANAINESLYKKLPFDFRRDFVPVSQLVELPNVLILNNDVPITSVKALIEDARKNPQKYSYASAGTGTSTHLAAELFKAMADVQIQHVPYKGSSPAMTDLRGGRVQLMFDNIPSALPQVKSGAVKAVALTGLKPNPQLPDLPTISDSGLPGYQAVAWHGIAAPKGTSAAIVKQLSQAVGKALSQPETIKQIGNIGAVPVASTPQEFEKHIASEIDKWAKVVKASGASVD